jgi:CO/xanthine dehydrogenase FAD-binding subunit
LIEAADELKGKEITDEVIESLAEASYKQAHPVNNASGLAPTYRRDMVRIYVRSAVDESLETATRQGGAT